MVGILAKSLASCSEFPFVAFFLQYFDTVGLGLLICKTVSQITYTVLVETLNHAQSIERPFLIAPAAGPIAGWKNNNTYNV